MHYRTRKGGHEGAGHDKIEPLYATLDALNCLEFFGELEPFRRKGNHETLRRP
jgi:hypothetical protein